MSWNYTSKDKVVAFAQVPTGLLEDEWSDWVEALIDEWMGTTFVGTSAHLNELHNGDNTPTLFVDHPPIVSVSLLEVDGGNFVLPSYVTYPYYIELIESSDSQVSTSLYRSHVFPSGVGNVKISYVGGSSVVPKKVEMAATMMVTAIATYASREGADASLKWSRVITTDGTNQTQTESSGLPSTLDGIMKKLLPRKVLIG